MSHYTKSNTISKTSCDRVYFKFEIKCQERNLKPKNENVFVFFVKNIMLILNQFILEF